MKDALKKVLACFMVLILVLPFLGSAVPVKAAEAKDLKMGFRYESNSWNKEYYKITLDKETLLHFEVEVNKNNIDKQYTIALLNAAEKNVLTKSQFFQHTDTFSEKRTYRAATIVSPGVYYFYLYGGSVYVYGGAFTVTEQEPVTLKKVKIESVESTKKGTLTVQVSEKDEDAEHIDIEYATDPDFTDSKVVSIDEKDTVTIKGLEKGKKYYLRARQVTYYGDGGMSVSAWSIVKSKTTRKK